MPITVSNDSHGSVLTVAISGDVDLATSPVMRAALNEAVTTPGVTAVDVDLSAVGFLDSSGISALLNGRRDADEHGVAFRVTGTQAGPRRVLEMTGVWAHLSGDPGST